MLLERIVRYYLLDHPERLDVALKLAQRFLIPLLQLRAKFLPRKAVLYVGQAYYNAWYLSRELRKLGWRADVLNWDPNPADQIYYHGQDFSFDYPPGDPTQDEYVLPHLLFYLRALWRYDIFHFSNAHAMVFGYVLHPWVEKRFGTYAEIALLKQLGKHIVYSNNGCLDGVAQSSFAKWGNEPVCSICRWKDEPSVCSDERNLAWGKLRNGFADYQCTLGGNRADYNDDPRVHEVPQFYCLDPEVWRPNLDIPEKYCLHFPKGTLRLYHAVGNFDLRTSTENVNIKSTHIYIPLIDRLKNEGLPVELMFYTNVPNKELRFYQVQADIFLDMLTFGFFGANAREAMMLGKPVICYLRPEWLDSMRREIPEYVDELPVVSATPANIYEVLKDLIVDREKREEIGRRSRKFALKWHSSKAAARRFDRIYRDLLKDRQAFGVS